MMRRKLCLLVILFFLLVGKERSYCAQQEHEISIAAECVAFLAEHPSLIRIIISLPCSFEYWILDLHQKQRGWYTCKFFYAVGYRTELFYNNMFYLDFYMNFCSLLFWLFIVGSKELAIINLFLMNMNIRMTENFYFVFVISILDCLYWLKEKLSSQRH